MLETTPSPRWQRRPDERPDEILDAALEVFGAQGFAGARLEDIARQAGVSKGTLYLYFDSKEALFRAMVRARVVSVLEEGERELLHAKGDTRTKLALLMRRIWAVVGDPSMARIIKLVHGELNNFPELALRSARSALEARFHCCQTKLGVAAPDRIGPTIKL